MELGRMLLMVLLPLVCRQLPLLMLLRCVVVAVRFPFPLRLRQISVTHQFLIMTLSIQLILSSRLVPACSLRVGLQLQPQ